MTQNTFALLTSPDFPLAPGNISLSAGSVTEVSHVGNATLAKVTGLTRGDEVSTSLVDNSPQFPLVFTGNPKSFTVEDIRRYRLQSGSQKVIVEFEEALAGVSPAIHCNDISTGSTSFGPPVALDDTHIEISCNGMTQSGYVEVAIDNQMEDHLFFLNVGENRVLSVDNNWTATPNGDADNTTTSIALTFDFDATGLRPTDFAIDDSIDNTGITHGELTLAPNGRSGSLAVSGITSSGVVSLSVGHTGMDFEPESHTFIQNTLR